MDKMGAELEKSKLSRGMRFQAMWQFDINRLR